MPTGPGHRESNILIDGFSQILDKLVTCRVQSAIVRLEPEVVRF
jgi:hypothetical protein